ncbi:hypothetical protein NPIL_444641 [Nephila pilipes]|uniref:Uncharacterized protein n=1 Tax=Nephila pilipes TaxID=299642 RepID=A0A8X6JLQ1_NEPPI|nr:hypothetical protein NPIL_444641 [Nephila pilipes]
MRYNISPTMKLLDPLKAYGVLDMLFIVRLLRRNLSNNKLGILMFWIRVDTKYADGLQAGYMFYYIQVIHKRSRPMLILELLTGFGRKANSEETSFSHHQSRIFMSGI